MWQLDVTPKIHLFTWRILHGIVPSNLNLIMRYVNVEPACKRCGDPIESSEHAFRDYPWLQQCWTLLPFRLELQNSDVTLESWLADTISVRIVEGQELVVAVLWAIWYARNEWVFLDKQSDPYAIIVVVKQTLPNHKKLVQRSTVPAAASKATRWIPLGACFFKLNTDASYRVRADSGLGGALRNCRGEDCWGFARKVKDGVTDCMNSGKRY